MHDIRVLSSGDMCMTLSGHTSTLPRLVVQGHGFEASFLRWAQVKYVPHVGRFITKAMMFKHVRTRHVRKCSNMSWPRLKNNLPGGKSPIWPI